MKGFEATVKEDNSVQIEGKLRVRIGLDGKNGLSCHVVN